jgi:hypothetical protein
VNEGKRPVDVVTREERTGPVAQPPQGGSLAGRPMLSRTCGRGVSTADIPSNRHRPHRRCRYSPGGWLRSPPVRSGSPALTARTRPISAGITRWIIEGIVAGNCPSPRGLGSVSQPGVRESGGTTGPGCLFELQNERVPNAYGLVRGVTSPDQSSRLGPGRDEVCCLHIGIR